MCSIYTSNIPLGRWTSVSILQDANTSRLNPHLLIISISKLRSSSKSLWVGSVGRCCRDSRTFFVVIFLGRRLGRDNRLKMFLLLLMPIHIGFNVLPGRHWAVVLLAV